MASSKRQQLVTQIVLSGKVDSTAKYLSTWLDNIGDKALSMGKSFERIGSKLMEYERLYADFDDSMRATQGKLVTATKKQMGELEEQVRAWAETTRFGAVETANAVKEAASSGWELTEIYEGIPTVMLLAQAASLDLTDATEYLNSALAGMNLEISDSETLVDQWVMAANRSRASVSDLGEAMQRLGSLMTFSESSDEVLTLLSVMAEYGTKGSEAGTLLRNVMLRLIAPTAKAAETLDMLNASEEELAELELMDTTAAAQAIDSLGLSVYDQEGNLKSIIQVISELRQATEGMTEEEMYPTLATIFPTRTLRGIMDLLRTSDEEYAAIQNRILSSGGYAQQIAELQEGGVGGSMRNLSSAWEELRLTIGEAMAPHLIKAFDALSEAIMRVSDMPEGVWDMIGRLFSTIVEAGPILVGVGMTLKLAATLLTPTGRLTAGVLAVISLFKLMDDTLEKKRQAALDTLFGSVTLDVNEMMQAIGQTNGALSAQEQALSDLKTELQQTGNEYVTSLSNMTQKLTQWSITGQELTQEQKDGLTDLGEQMIAQVEQGIQGSELYNLNMLDVLFGDPERAGEAETFSGMALLRSERYKSLYNELGTVGQKLREQLVSALMDGTLDANETEAIKASLDRLTEIEQEIMQGVADREFGETLYKAKKVTADTMEDFLKEADAAMQEELNANAEKYAAEAGVGYADYKYGMENATSEAERQNVQRIYDAYLEQLAAEEASSADLIKEHYQEPINKALDSVFETAGQKDAWELFKKLFEEYPGLTGMSAAKNQNEWLLSDTFTNAGIENSLSLMKAFGAANGGGVLTNLLKSAGLKDMAEAMASISAISTQVDLNAYKDYLDALLQNEKMERNGVTITRDKKIPLTDKQLKNIETQGAQDAQTYADAVQAELSKENIQLPVSLVGNGVQVGATNGGGSSGSRSGGLFSRIRSLFADGGRATEASIFGEAGPEWAIPEAHTPRTASLLKAAAEASGFTVAIGNTASSGGSSGPATVIYSPVINARDARGVEGVLRADKANLEKWWNERTARAKAEAFG